jgi:transcriptional regulator with GAF, ATPase, and Fis domain
VADNTCTVLIVGETGTGKELVAQAIHRMSPRGDRVMPVVNCGALPSELVESELFGHERGAFTGATQARPGFAEQAHGSTLFLDEIGEMPISLQPKLLRFLQNKTFHRVGGTRETTVDTRVLCATNRDPAELASQKRLREDLYYRMSQVTIRVPSLRERKQDIPLLAETFLQRLQKRDDGESAGFDPEAMELLTEYHWPGNVRHLLNVITELVVLHAPTRVTADILPTDIVQSVRDRHRNPAHPPRHPSGTPTPSPTLPILPLWEMERQVMHQALLQFSGNVSLAAHELQISPATLYRKIQRYGLRQAVARSGIRERTGDAGEACGVNKEPGTAGSEQ